MKTHVTLSVDLDLIREIRKTDINMSAAFSEYITILLNRHNKDIDGINIVLERKKLSKLHKKLADIQVELTDCQNAIRDYEALQEKKEEERLKAEKKAMEAASRCKNCGNTIQGKSHSFKTGLICHSCFLVCSKEDIERWSK